MRKIEHKMVEALLHARPMHEGNTKVTPEGTVYLHGNRIAYLELGIIVRDDATFKRWPTRTTKSRLKALGLPTT